MIKFLKLGFCAVFLLILFTGCNKTPAVKTPPSPVESPGEWVTIIEFESDFNAKSLEASSEVFEVGGGVLRIMYDIDVSANERDNARVYIMPEGQKVSEDEIEPDFKAIGNKRGAERNLKRDAGRYYINVKTSAVNKCRIRIEEKVVSPSY